MTMTISALQLILRLLTLATYSLIACAAFLPIHQVRNVHGVVRQSNTLLQSSLINTNFTAPASPQLPSIRYGTEEETLSSDAILLHGKPDWRSHVPNFIIRTLDDVHQGGNIKEAATKTWESRRYLTRADGFGFSFHHTILRAGESTLIRYSNHVEGVLVTSGEGEIELCHDDQEEGEGFAVLKLAPGTFYGLGGQEKHYLRASPEADMHVSCAFNPPVDGAEDHDEHGVYPAIGEDGIKRYKYAREETYLLFKPPTTLANGSNQDVASKTDGCESTSSMPFVFGDITIRSAELGDGKLMWRLAKDAGLDLNSAYMYNLFCHHYTDTCAIAIDKSGQAVAYLLGYKPPKNDGTLFVWQIGVHPNYQKQQIAMTMLTSLVTDLDVSYLEATVTSSNIPSNKLFQSFAMSNGCDFIVDKNWITENDFPSEDSHEGEQLYRIGPITKSRDSHYGYGPPQQLLDNILKVEKSTSFFSFVNKSNGETGLSHISHNEMLSELMSKESNARTYSRKFPFVIASARGCTLTDTDGNKYLDFLACAGTLALGHNHPIQNNAMLSHFASGKPLQSLDISTTAKCDYVKELFSFLPTAFQDDYRIQFCGGTGSDAIDAAVKLCKIATGRSMVFVFHGAYHGVGQGPLAMTGNLHMKDVPGMSNQNVHFLPFPSRHRNPFGINGDGGDKAVMAYISNVLDDCESGVSKPACIMLEVVQGEGGLQSISNWALHELHRIAKQYDIPLVIDEVQSGFCRTGSRFAFEHSGIIPDVLVLSKAAGGSQPLSCIVYNKQLDKWEPGMHSGTFRGNGLAFSAGAATLKFMREQNLSEKVKEKGELFYNALEASKCKYIGNIRGLGLMMGIELVQPSEKGGDKLPKACSELCAQTQVECLKRGLIIEKGGRGGTVLRPLPPLIVTDEEIKHGVRVIVDSINAAAKKVFD